eukprot:GHVP01003437.1.p1 GENE.GHVP01003437.1~~GHVP01003437.1.p1  ORF type:complete len:106 (+),score=10.52 GHVP01003437.1:274-591(+)
MVRDEIYLNYEGYNDDHHDVAEMVNLEKAKPTEGTDKVARAERDAPMGAKIYAKPVSQMFVVHAKPVTERRSIRVIPTNQLPAGRRLGRSPDGVSRRRLGSQKLP